MHKILVIDDSKTQLASLKIFLSRHDFEVEIAENGIDGYKKTIENPPDIVICDVMMPNLNGYQFCRLLKNNPLTQRIPIILLTSLNQNIDKFWGDKSGANLFVSKNCALEDLIAKIKDTICENPVEEGIKKTILNTPALKNALQSKINDILDSSLMEATIMSEFRKLVKNIENTELFLKDFFKLLSSIFNYNLCTISFTDKELTGKQTIYVSTEHCKFTEDELHKFLNNENLEINITTGTEADLSYREDMNFTTNYTIDLEINNELLGKVCLYSYANIDYTDFHFFEIVKNEMAIVAKIRNLYVQTKFLSITDGLTSLYNRRYFFENFEREFDRTKRYKSKLSVAMLDIDFFKKINDNYGHQAGDAVLKSLAQTITKTLRKTDLIFRYGGEEIIILLPETSIEQAFIPLERLREFIDSYYVNFGNKAIKYTVSIGIAEASDSIEQSDDLIAMADKALYNAKNGGRNRVILYE